MPVLRPCLACGTLVTTQRCRACSAARERGRGSPSRRGYDWAYQTARTRVLERDGRICQWCGRPGADTADHVIPLAHGGSSDDANLVAAHRSCNSARRPA